MLHWSPDLEGHAIIARKISLESASERVEMESASVPSIQSEPANMDSTAFRTSDSAVLCAPLGGGGAGLGEREPSPELSEGRARAMYGSRHILWRSGPRLESTYLMRSIRVVWKNSVPFAKGGLNAFPSLWRTSGHWSTNCRVNWCSSRIRVSTPPTRSGKAGLSGRPLRDVLTRDLFLPRNRCARLPIWRRS